MSHMPSTKESIITLPNKSLRTRSKKIGVIDDAIKQLITDMESATLDWEASRKHEVGVALAAIQINQKYRVVVIRSDFNDKNNKDFSVFINPEITKFEGKVEDDYEGCLSIKDIYGKVPRHTKVRIKALSENGSVIRLKAEGFLARVFQHEIDHTNGIVFIDHIREQSDAFCRLNEDGDLEPLDYEKEIKNNAGLWE